MVKKSEKSIAKRKNKGKRSKKNVDNSRFDIIIIDKKKLINKTISESDDESKNLYKLEIKGLFFKHRNKFFNSIEISYSISKNYNFDIVINKREIFSHLNKSELFTEDKFKLVANKRKRKNSKNFCQKKNFYKEKFEKNNSQDIADSFVYGNSREKFFLSDASEKNLYEFKASNKETAIVVSNSRDIVIKKSLLIDNNISVLNDTKTNNQNKINFQNILSDYNIIEIDLKKMNVLCPIKEKKLSPAYNPIYPLTSFPSKCSHNSQSHFPSESKFLNSNKSLNNSQMNNFLNKNKYKNKQMNLDFANNINQLSENFFDFCDLNSSSIKLNNTLSQIIPIMQVESINLTEEESVIQNRQDILKQSRLNPNSEPFLSKDKDEEFVVKYYYKSLKGNETSLLLYENDFHKLDPKVYLNDNIILFYLKFIENELVSNELIGKFIIFDTFFYNKLEKEDDGCFETGMKNYNSIKNWTKKLKIFQNEYLIIPINENNEHWSLIIILYPGRMANIFSENETESNEYPVIIYLDSFYDNNIRCINIFKKYLFYEYAVKIKNSKIDEGLIDFICINHNKIKIFVPNVPKQNNTYDCGIYLLAYAELFLYEPDYITQRIREDFYNLTDWFNNSFMKTKRKDIQHLLIQLFNSENNLKSKAEIVNQFTKNREETIMNSYRRSGLKENESNLSNLMDCDLSDLSFSSIFNNNYVEVNGDDEL